MGQQGRVRVTSGVLAVRDDVIITQNAWRDAGKARMEHQDGLRSHGSQQGASSVVIVTWTNYPSCSGSRPGSLPQDHVTDSSTDGY